MEGVRLHVHLLGEPAWSDGNVASSVHGLVSFARIQADTTNKNIIQASGKGKHGKW